MSFSRVSGLKLFQAYQLVSASSKQLSWSQSLKIFLPRVFLAALFCKSQRNSQSLLLALALSGLVNLVSFKDFGQLFRVLYLSALIRELPIKTEPG